MDWLCCFFFIALLVAVGLVVRASSESRFLFAGRSTSLFALTATLVMTEFNTATLIAFSSMGYLCGYAALALPIVFLVGLLFYAFAVAKKWKEFNGNSVAGFFTQRYGRVIGLLASVSLLVAMAGFSATYVKSLTMLFPLHPALILVPILAMTLRGGLASIIATDVVSFCAVLIFFVAALFFAPDGDPISVEPLPARFLVSLTILTMFTYILAPWYGQKIFAARTPRIAFLSVLFASVLVVLLYGPAILLTARLATSVSPEMALPAVIAGS